MYHRKEIVRQVGYLLDLYWYVFHIPETVKDRCSSEDSNLLGCYTLLLDK